LPFSGFLGAAPTDPGQSGEKFWMLVQIRTKLTKRASVTIGYLRMCYVLSRSYSSPPNSIQPPELSCPSPTLQNNFIVASSIPSDSSNVLYIHRSSECSSILLFLACGVADSLQSIEVEGNKQYWFVENVMVADVIGWKS